MILIFTIPFAIILWFVMVRPQQQRMKEHRELIEDLRVGDRVITAGGIHGELHEVAEETVRIEVADGVVLTLARPAVAKRVNPDDGRDDPVDEPDDVTDEVGPQAAESDQEPTR